MEKNTESIKPKRNIPLKWKVKIIQKYTLITM